jgi:hypothetical protein
MRSLCPSLSVRRKEMEAEKDRSQPHAYIPQGDTELQENFLVRVAHRR